MEFMMARGKLEESFFNKIKHEVKILANINYILDKIDRDGYLKVVR